MKPGEGKEASKEKVEEKEEEEREEEGEDVEEEREEEEMKLEEISSLSRAELVDLVLSFQSSSLSFKKQLSAANEALKVPFPFLFSSPFLLSSFLFFHLELSC